jgi:hypothetical protein
MLAQRLKGFVRRSWRSIRRFAYSMPACAQQLPARLPGTASSTAVVALKAYLMHPVRETEEGLSLRAVGDSAIGPMR